MKNFCFSETIIYIYLAFSLINTFC